MISSSSLDYWFFPLLSCSLLPRRTKSWVPFSSRFTPIRSAFHYWHWVPILFAFHNYHFFGSEKLTSMQQQNSILLFYCDLLRLFQKDKHKSLTQRSETCPCTNKKWSPCSGHLKKHVECDTKIWLKDPAAFSSTLNTSVPVVSNPAYCQDGVTVCHVYWNAQKFLLL